MADTGSQTLGRTCGRFSSPGRGLPGAHDNDAFAASSEVQRQLTRLCLMLRYPEIDIAGQCATGRFHFDWTSGCAARHGRCYFGTRDDPERSRFAIEADACGTRQIVSKNDDCRSYIDCSPQTQLAYTPSFVALRPSALCGAKGMGFSARTSVLCATANVQTAHVEVTSATTLREPFIDASALSSASITARGMKARCSGQSIVNVPWR